MSDFDYVKFYDQISPFYGWGLRLLPIWRRYTEAVLPWIPEGSVILEIGPGPGVLLQTLSFRGRAAIGVDLSPGMLAQCQKRLIGQAMPANLIRAHGVHLPLADGCVDAVVTTFAFSAIPDGLGAMTEFARVLRPGGVVALVDAGRPTDGNPFGRLLAQTWQYFGDFMRDEAGLMVQAGLDVVHRQEFGAFQSIRLVVGQRR